MRSFIFSLVIFSFLQDINVYAKDILFYTNNSNELKTNEHKPKKGYTYEILKLALDKTVDKYGAYELHPAAKMNKERAIFTTKSNKTKNLILNASASEKLINDKDLIYINFPIHRGLFGYRIAFISPFLKKEDYDSLEKIKKLKIGQGKGWLDTKILKFNDFNVRGYSNHKGLFKMVSIGRINMFLRGITEIKKEIERNKSIDNLHYDKTFLLYYPLPKFFFTHKSNKKAIKRLKEGLMIAFDDGSFNKLFNKYYKKYINFIKIKNRTIYKIKNPYLSYLNKSYEKYNINILKD